MQFTSVRDQHAPGLFPGPFCWQVSPATALVTDLATRISTDGPICTSLGARAARCTTNLIVGLVIQTGNRGDAIKIPSGNPPAAVYAGAGNDDVSTANGSRYDWVSCGPGNDAVTADPGDHVEADCERVTRVG